MTSRLRVYALLLALLATGCAHSIHQVHVSDFDPYASRKKAKVVRARAERFVVLHFSFETDYVDKAYAKLQSECKGGRIVGITTQHSTSLGFFSWTDKILMQGLCVRG